jgi:hypothetical protein
MWLPTEQALLALSPAYLRSEMAEAEWRAGFVDDPSGTVGEASKAAYPGATPTQVGSEFGYVQAQVMRTILQKARDNKDLTRQGTLNALRQISGLDTGGLVAGPLDYTSPTQLPARASTSPKWMARRRAG